MKKTLMKTLIAMACLILASGSVFGAAKNKANKQEADGMYDLIIHGYDWGPGVDKLVLHLEKEVAANKIKPEEFKVATTTMGLKWTSWPPKLEEVSGYREITAAYACDEAGNKVDGKSKLIALDLSVHPDNAFSNPFLYGSDMMNHWQELYDVKIENEKLGLKITKFNKRICPEADQFVISENTADGITLHYASWEPPKAAKSSNGKIPLIIWLHGMGEGGNDPYITLLGNKVVNLITDDVQKNFTDGAYVLAPQVNGFWMQSIDEAPGTSLWIDKPDVNPLSKYTKSLFALIDTYVKNNPKIDANRIYIGGCSNGGYMTMNMLLNYPDYFAAAYPVCQAYPDAKIDDEKLAILAKQPIWFTQAKNDTTVNPPMFTVETFKRLQAVGAADVHFSFWDRVTDQTGNFKKGGKPYDYNGHFSWIYTLNNECVENGVSIFEWLAKHSK